MPPTDHHASFLNRISIRRNQVVSMDVNHEQELEQLELFHKHVSDRFTHLSPPQSPPLTTGEQPPVADTPDPLLSIAWFRKLLDVYLCCESEFKAVLIIGRDASEFSKPPLDRLLPDHLDRTVKALDICNAITHGIEVVRHLQRLAQIAVDALEQRPIVEGHVRRAKKALNMLLASMMTEDKEQNVNAGKMAERMWSMGRRGGGGGGVAPPAVNRNRSISVSRSLSSTFSKSWSASKQIQAMATNLVAPRGGDPTGLTLPVYLMSSILVFVMWTLVAAVPCPERMGPGTHVPLPRHLVWVQPMIALQEKIGDEWKKKEKKGTAGLLAEIQVIEKVAQNLVEFADGFEFPVSGETADEVAVQVAEMAEICRKLEVGLGPLQLQVRELFHRMVRSRAEVLDVMDRVGKINTNVPC